MRNDHFSTSASNTVSIYIPPTGCLWVVDETISLLQGTGVEGFPSYAELTNQDRIMDADTGVNGLRNIYDFNGSDTWCYYFEKGDLARSKGQWEKAISYFEQARNANLVPLEGIEYLPFVSAYMHTGDIANAVTLSQAALKKSYLTKPPLCQIWHDQLKSDPNLDTKSISAVYNADVCPAFFTTVQP